MAGFSSARRENPTVKKVLTVATTQETPRRGASAQRRQPPPEGAQAGVELVPALLELNVENFCSTCLEPQWGQAGFSWVFPRISFSKTFPHFPQTYSKIGMAA
jgi:hypothetical protein